MNFNFEAIGNKNSSAHELLSKKYAIFFRKVFMRTRVLIINSFKIEIHQSRAKLLSFSDFQAITLRMGQYTTIGKRHLFIRPSLLDLLTSSRMFSQVHLIFKTSTDGGLSGSAALSSIIFWKLMSVFIAPSNVVIRLTHFRSDSGSISIT